MPWLDGVAYGADVVPFDVTDRGLLLGDGVFDTALVLGGQMVWREAHVARLVAACGTLGFAPEPARIDAAIEAVLGERDHGSMRITVTRGPAPRGLAPPADQRPSVLATAAPLRRRGFFQPLRLHLTAIRRNETSPAARIKSSCYLDAVLAMREALSAACDDALFLNTRGRVACTTVGNVLALIGDKVVTPPPTDGIVPGIARAEFLGACRSTGLEPIERSLSLDELRLASAVCVTNSLRLASPVTAIGGWALRSSTDPRWHALVAHLAHRVRVETGVDVHTLTGC